MNDTIKCILILAYIYMPCFIIVGGALLKDRYICSYAHSIQATGKLVLMPMLALQSIYASNLILGYMHVSDPMLIVGWPSFVLVINVLTLVYIYYYIKWAANVSPLDIFAISATHLPFIIKVCGVLMIYNTISLLVFGHNYWLSCDDQDLYIFRNRGIFNVLAMLLHRIILSPILEEVAFRGLLFPMLYRKVGRYAAMCLSSFLWAFAHFYPLRLSIGLFILGMIFVWLYDRRGSLVHPLVLHMFKNSWILAYYAGIC